MGTFPHPATYVIGWLLLGLAMRFATYDAAFASLTQIVGQGARRAISYLTLFGGLASTVFWPVSHYLALGIGWADTLLVYAGLNLFVCLPIHWLVLHGARGDQTATRVANTPVQHLAGRGRLMAITLFATALALNGLVFSSISAHAVPLFQGLGFRGNEAVFMAALIGPSQVASRLGEIVMGHLLDLDQVAYVRYASVYRDFHEAADFNDLVGTLRPGSRSWAGGSEEAKGSSRA